MTWFVDHEYKLIVEGYKWGNVVIGALAVLAVTIASSMMSAAIFDIRKQFPGYSSEAYIMSRLIYCVMKVVLINSHIRLRTGLRGRSTHLGTMLRSLWSSKDVLPHLLAIHGVRSSMLWCPEVGSFDRTPILCRYIWCFLLDIYRVRNRLTSPA